MDQAIINVKAEAIRGALAGLSMRDRETIAAQSYRLDQADEDQAHNEWQQKIIDAKEAEKKAAIEERRKILREKWNLTRNKDLLSLEEIGDVLNVPIEAVVKLTQGKRPDIAGGGMKDGQFFVHRSQVAEYLAQVKQLHAWEPALVEPENSYRSPSERLAEKDRLEQEKKDVGERQKQKAAEIERQRKINRRAAEIEMEAGKR